MVAATLAASCAGDDASVESAGSDLRPVELAADAGPSAGFQGRADIDPTGNRVSRGAGDLDGPAIEVVLDSPAIWLVPSAPTPAAPWAAVLADGHLVWIEPATGEVVVLDEAWGDAEPIVHAGDRVDRWDLLEDFPAALPDGRSVTGSGSNVSGSSVTVVLADPTDRYRHGVLGDVVEAGAIEIYAADGGAAPAARVELVDEVVEGRSALLGDADGDGVDEILVTQSESERGARLVLYDLAGERLAESTAVGRGNRWRSQIAIAPVGPDGEIEIIDVRTPHLGRTIEWFRLDGDALVRVAELDGFTNHVLGSRNLDLGIVADADGDGRLEVVVPTADRRALGVVGRTGSGAELEFTVELSGRLSSNVGAVDHPDGGVTYAAATDDGVVRFWVS